jgi:cobalt-zinc-cadmium efflux system protein
MWHSWTWIDPVVSLVIAVVVVIGTWSLFHRSLHLLFDGVPESVDLDAVRDCLLALPGVAEVHDLHVWAMATNENALTAHLVLKEGTSQTCGIIEQARENLHELFEIQHVTLQVETTDQAALCPAMHCS